MDLAGGAMTDAEFWGMLAEMIEGAGCLPGECACGCGAPPNGLCMVLMSAHKTGLIDSAQRSMLAHQLQASYGHLGFSFYWPIGEIRPRIAACRVLMREALERDGR